MHFKQNSTDATKVDKSHLGQRRTLFQGIGYQSVQPLSQILHSYITAWPIFVAGTLFIKSDFLDP